ncbi:MAG: hypothetical protein PVF43_11390 [Candidatus Eiseniibacteriota bacterium]
MRSDRPDVGPVCVLPQVAVRRRRQRHITGPFSVVLAVVVVAASILLDGARADTPPDGDSDTSPAVVPADGEGYLSLGQLIARWRTFVAQYRDVPREIRVEESKQFFAAIPWENIRYLCLEGSAGVGPDSAHMPQFIVQYRMEVAPPPLDTVIDFVEDLDICVPCKEPIRAWAYDVHDSLDAGDRDRLARAFLRYAASPAPPPNVRDRFFVAAAAISDADTLMTLMQRDVGSSDSTAVNRGLRMLATAAHPAAADTMAAAMRRLRDAGSPLFTYALDLCRERCATHAFDLLVETYRAPWSSHQRMRALCDLAQVDDPRASHVILAGYEDGGAIVDSTFTSRGEDRARYYELWLATHIHLPVLLDWLRTGNDEEAALAIELLDRGFRFGPMPDGEEVVAALEQYAARTSGTWRERVLSVLARAQSPPRPGPQGPPGLPPGGRRERPGG